ncbi:MAG: tRNA glutamyl-Q(34) synthetase GluQRS [Pseudomonadales bacterium]|nr:tRNA glutamyl-Q(34) synthetase GluQRS [Pseudomonadales bacterium]
MPVKKYVGRFAPTPSGPLHFGSLVTAVASYLDARSNGGTWHVRIDDLDSPRVVIGAERRILTTLEKHGLEWDGPIVRQSSHRDLYKTALENLEKQGLLFTCYCSRKELIGKIKYPGTCRDSARPNDVHSSLRIRVPDQPYQFNDLVQGLYSENLSCTVGDFVVSRRDGIPSYQIAVVVDDNNEDVSHIVRGADLMDNTSRQLYLREMLSLPIPRYAHVPVFTHASGIKLSKHSEATAIDDRFSCQNLQTALQVLGQPVPMEKPVDRLLASACLNWKRALVPKTPSILNFVSV